LGGIPPFTFTFLRFFISGLILLPFVKNQLSVKIKDLPILILLSLTGVTLTISFINIGLKMTSSINAPIIQSASPIILIIGSFFFLKERAKRKTIFGTLISFIGVLIIVLMPLFAKGWDGSVSGNLFIVFATIFSVIHVLLLKKILPNYRFLTIAFWTFIIGSLPLVPFVNTEFLQYNWIANLTTPIILGLIFSIKYINASEEGIFTYVDPVATILVAVPLLGEKITPPYLLGAFLVFLGIFIAEGRLHYHPIHKLFN
jgi:drug/metabolite transporter (DMT)-like permease